MTLSQLRDTILCTSPPSSSGLGRGPLKAKTGIRIPVGAQIQMESVTNAPHFCYVNVSKMIKYPRYRIRRAILDGIGKALIGLLTNVNIEGLENIPKTGPVILAGNHVESLESAFQALYPKRVVEPIGAGDIPFDRGLDKFVNLYGFIAVDRGTVDRAALREAQSVLEQGAALGIFPEGGTWRPAKMPAQIGVALLSERGKAPVIPIGYSGFIGAVKAALKFQRPKLTMRVGKPIPALVIDPNGAPVKEQMQAYADKVMDEVHALLDEAEHNIMPEREILQLTICREKDGDKLQELEPVQGGEAFVSLINTKVILDTLALSLKLPTQPFFPGQESISAGSFIEAINATLTYLEEKPTFFTYRMGQEMGEQIPGVLKQLKQYVTESKDLGQDLILDGYVEAFYLNGEERQTHHIFKIVAD